MREGVSIVSVVTKQPLLGVKPRVKFLVVTTYLQQHLTLYFVTVKYITLNADDN